MPPNRSSFGSFYAPVWEPCVLKRKLHASVREMALYRLYALNKDGQIFGPADLIEADTDESAIEKAERLRGSLDQELWQDNRIVITLKTGTPMPRADDL